MSSASSASPALDVVSSLRRAQRAHSPTSPPPVSEPISRPFAHSQPERHSNGGDSVAGRSGTVVWITLAAVGSAAADQDAIAAADTAARSARARSLLYSLDYDLARAALREAIAADPRNPSAYRQLAAADWLK